MLLIYFLSLIALTESHTVSPPPSNLPLGPFYVIDPQNFVGYFPEGPAQFKWAQTMIPFIDLPLNNYSEMLSSFYYRTRSYWSHVHWTGDEDGFVVTEFGPDVNWAGKHNTISGSAGHHIREGRWFHDERILNDYVRFWYKDTGGKPRLTDYSLWILNSEWQRSLLIGDQTTLKDVFLNASDAFLTLYVEAWLSNSTTNHGFGFRNRTCWVIVPGIDAMEVSISGSGCRPTIGSMMFGEASALAGTAALLGDTQAQRTFENWANFSREVILKQQWNPQTQVFATLSPPNRNPQPKIGTCDLDAIRGENTLVSVRELFGYMPFFYGQNNFQGSLIPADEAALYSPIYKWLLPDSGGEGFTGPWGLRSCQLSTPCYNYSWEHGDCWNGPSWPYETSRVLTSLGNLLQEGSDKAIQASKMSPAVFEDLLQQYVRQHIDSYATNDTANPAGSGHVFENIHPDLGYWNDREILYWSNSSMKDMGDDYNHSTFIDIILSILFGIRPGPDLTNAALWLTINPLIDSVKAPWFAVDHVKYRGRILSLVWDSDGDHYEVGQGLSVLVDGKVVANRPDLGPLVVSHPSSN